MLPVREPYSLELRLPPREVGSAKLDCPTDAANKTTVVASSAIAAERNGGTATAEIMTSLTLTIVLPDAWKFERLAALLKTVPLIRVLTSSKWQSSSKDCRSAVTTTTSTMREASAEGTQVTVKSVSIVAGSTSFAASIADSPRAGNAIVSSTGMEAIILSRTLSLLEGMAATVLTMTLMLPLSVRMIPTSPKMRMANNSTATLSPRLGFSSFCEIRRLVRARIDGYNILRRQTHAPDNNRGSTLSPFVVRVHTPSSSLPPEVRHIECCTDSDRSSGLTSSLWSSRLWSKMLVNSVC